MSRAHSPLTWIAAASLALLAAVPARAAVSAAVPSLRPASGGFTSRADSAPRKVVISSVVADISGSVADRVRLVAKLLDAAARDAAARYPGRGLDLMVFPEFAICREAGTTAADRAVELTEPGLEILRAKAREHHTWIVVPMTLREGARISNAAVLFDRSGRVAGIFRKVHPVVDDRGLFEGGVTPGEGYPVFDCDFGRVGILICWDMSYEAAWDALGAGGAEIVALPSASPRNLQPMAQALRHHYYVVNSAPRDNASLFDPIGRTTAQVTAAPGVFVAEIDLAYAILHWSETLHEGRALTERFGGRVGGTYSAREDTGIFWSNDPKTSIGAMIRELGLREMPAMIELMETGRRK
jgi:predicted amidohydrolase